VYGNACVYGNAEVCENDCEIFFNGTN